MLVGDIAERNGRTQTTALSPRPLRTIPPPKKTLLDGGRRNRLGIDVVPLVLAIDCAAVASAALTVPLGVNAAALLLLCILVVNAGGGHYRARVAPSLLDELPSIAARALVAGALVAALRLLAGDNVRDAPVIAALVFIPFAALGRLVGYGVIRHHRRSGRLAQPTLIVGCGQVGNQLAEALKAHPEYGLQPVGYVDDDPLIPAAERQVPLLGATDELTDLLVDYRIRNVIFAFTTSRESVLVDLVRACDRMACDIFFVPRLFELHGSGGAETELIWGLPMTRLRRASYRSLSWHAKRVFDFILSLVGILVLSPLMLVCALAVRMEGGADVIFRQERVGLDGRRFNMLKFRSLKPTDEVESAHRWNISDDARLGRVGRTLRRLSLDELPQLWNVLRGDMSLVGPRPERPVFVSQFTHQFPRYMARHRVPAGLTGWAQVNGLRGDTDIADRASFDNYYIENWSLWQDMKILIRTAGQVLGGRGR